MYHNITIEEVIQMDRLELIDVLEWNDSHGVYSDKDSKIEGIDPITREQAIKIILRQFELSEEEEE